MLIFAYMTRERKMSWKGVLIQLEKQNPSVLYSDSVVCFLKTHKKARGKALIVTLFIFII